MSETVRVDDLIKWLRDVREKHGNIPVCFYNAQRDYYGRYSRRDWDYSFFVDLESFPHAKEWYGLPEPPFAMICDPLE